jgi:predicted MFS family arabinose efflux permease
MCLFSVTWHVAVVVGPLFGGAALELGGPPVLWAGCGVLGLITAGLRLAIAGEQQRRLAATARTASAGSIQGGPR